MPTRFCSVQHGKIHGSSFCTARVGPVSSEHGPNDLFFIFRLSTLLRCGQDAGIVAAIASPADGLAAEEDLRIWHMSEELPSLRRFTQPACGPRRSGLMDCCICCEGLTFGASVLHRWMQDYPIHGMMLLLFTVALTGGLVAMACFPTGKAALVERTLTLSQVSKRMER